MFCPNCGDEIANNAKFCTSCGATLQSPTPVTYTPQQSKPKSKMRLRLLIGIPLLTIGLIWAISDGIKGANKAGTATLPTPTYNNSYADAVIAPTPTAVPAATDTPTPTPEQNVSIAGIWYRSGKSDGEYFNFTKTEYENGLGRLIFENGKYKVSGNKVILDNDSTSGVYLVFGDYLVYCGTLVFDANLENKQVFDYSWTLDGADSQYYEETQYLSNGKIRQTTHGLDLYGKPYSYVDENMTYSRNGSLIIEYNGYNSGIQSLRYYDDENHKFYTSVYVREGVDPTKPIEGASISAPTNTTTDAAKSVTQNGGVFYSTYSDAIFNMSWVYPESFVITDNVGYEDRFVAESSDGAAKLAVCATYNIEGYSAAEALELFVNSTGVYDGYKAKGKTWYVYTFDEGETRTYRKAFVSDEEIKWFDFTYPISKKDTYDAYTEYIEDNFKNK